MRSQYNRTQMRRALRDAGLKRGDVVFSHSNVGFFGLPDEGGTGEAIFQTVLGAFQDVIGEEGTLVVPTFSYSFCKREPFDPDHTPSTCGIFTERLRLHPASHRSLDPIFSVAALGARSEELTADLSDECFGKNSFWDRFFRADGVICNLNFDAGSTFVHYVERCLGVPYRYNKLFTGVIVQDGRAGKKGVIYFCRDLSNPDTTAAFEPLDTLAKERDLLRSEPVGRGAVVSIRASDVYRLIEEGLKDDPWFLTVAAGTGRTPALFRRTDNKRPDIHLPDNAPLEQVVEALWELPRDIVSEGYDDSLRALAERFPVTVHEYPTGTECWTWIVPEKWSCREARLETPDGRVIFDARDNPLHCMSYSLPRDAVLPRQELLPHLHTKISLPDGVPFAFNYYERDWGLCCSQKLKAALQEPEYRVSIRTDFSYGTLKVGEWVLPGKSEKSFVFCAHLDHPGQVNDGLSGVAVGLEVMRRLSKLSKLHYTYRLLIVPETIGSICWLSHNEGLIDRMVGGLFLEMLGLAGPHALQLSYFGDTLLDELLSREINAGDPEAYTAAFRRVVCNDDRQFNSPGVRVPMLSLSRVPRSNSLGALFEGKIDKSGLFYPEYHTDRDTIDACSPAGLRDSVSVVLSLVEAIEETELPAGPVLRPDLAEKFIPVNLYKGEISLSRYGLYLDQLHQPEEARALFDIMMAIDGVTGVGEIARRSNVEEGVARNVLARLEENGLIAWQNARDVAPHQPE